MRLPSVFDSRPSHHYRAPRVKSGPLPYSEYGCGPGSVPHLLGPRHFLVVEDAFVLKSHARPEGVVLPVRVHPGLLVEPASGTVLADRPNSDTLKAHRARDIEDVKDQREPDSCALRGGTHEHHRDVGRSVDRVLLRRRQTFQARPAPCLRFLVATQQTAGRLGLRVSRGCERCAQARTEPTGDVGLAPHADRSISLMGHMLHTFTGGSYAQPSSRAPEGPGLLSERAARFKRTYF